MERVMFRCPFCDNTEDYYRANNLDAHIRILNASPNTPAIDVYANDTIVVRNLVYRNFSQYLPLAPGFYNIKVYPAGMKVTPLLNTNVNIMQRSFSTLAFIGLVPNVSLYQIPEQTIRPSSGKACIRFVHLTLNTPPLDITSTSGEKLFKNVPYKGYTDYVCVEPGSHSIQVKVSGTNDIILVDPRIHLLPNRYYSIYSVGVGGGNPPLQILIALDGRSYIPS